MLTIGNGEVEYVKDGLICWLDGINNTRAGHSNATEIWEDLSGNGNDFNLNQAYINSNNLEFDGFSYLESKNSDLTYKTIEIVLYNKTDNTVCIYQGATSSNKVWYKNGSIGIGTSGSPKGNISAIMPIGDLTSISTYIGDGSDKKIFINSEQQLNSNVTASWGRNSSNPIIGMYNGSYGFIGKIYSIRMYNRELSEDEIKQNYVADSSRFNNSEMIPIYTANELLNIGSNKYIKIDQTGGKYYFFSTNATYVLMNDIEFNVSDFSNEEWIPIGRTNYIFDGNGKKITATTKSGDTIVCDETNSYTGAKGTYVKDGLICWLDGINNTRAGHSNATEIWEDLSGNGNDFNLNQAYINSNNLKFDGFSYLESKNSDLTYKTIEIVLYNKTDDTVCIYQGATSSNKVWYKNGSIGIGTSSPPEGNISAIMPIGDLTSISTYIGDGSDKKIFINSEQQLNSNVTASWGRNSSNPIIGMYNGSYGFRGKIYSIRMYNRELLEEEIQNNYNIDKQRFGL